MISVLCPTRNRPALLRRSLNSLVERAASPTKIELHVAVDPDDIVSQDALTPELARVVQYHVAPERYGYARLHEYYNLMAAHAPADWLLLWNDDAVMETDGWDWIIETLPPLTLVADLQTAHSPHLCTFPAVRRWAVDLLGGFSLHTPHADTWWQDIARQTSTIQSVPIHILHDRYDLTGNNLDQVRRESVAGYRSAEYYGPYIQGRLAEAADAIRTELLVRLENP